MLFIRSFLIFNIRECQLICIRRYPADIISVFVIIFNLKNTQYQKIYLYYKQQTLHQALFLFRLYKNHYKHTLFIRPFLTYVRECQGYSQVFHPADIIPVFVITINLLKAQYHKINLYLLQIANVASSTVSFHQYKNH